MTTETIEELKKLNSDLSSMMNDYKGLGESYRAMKGQVDDLTKKMSETITAYDGDIADLKKGLTAAPAAGPGAISPEMKGMVDYIIAGSLGTKSTATVANPSTGGYLAPAEFVNQVIPKLRDSDNIRANANVISVSGGLAQLPYEITNGSSHWVGERESRDNKDSGTIGLANIPIDTIVSQVAISKDLIAYGSIDIENYFTTAVSAALGQETEAAFAIGDGFKKPEGVFACSDIETVSSGAAAALTINGLIDAVGGLTSAASMNAKWYGSMNTLSKIAKLRDDKDPVWQPSLGAGLPPTVLGYSYMYCPSAPTVAAGSMSLVLGDMFSAYKIAQHTAIDLLRDEVTGRKDNLLYVQLTSRVGGQTVMPSSLVGVKTEAS